LKRVAVRQKFCAV